MTAWILRRGLGFARTEIGVRVDVGETAFSAYAKTLGAPAARYFGADGRECARGFIVRRKANKWLWRSLYEQLKSEEDGAAVDVTRRVAVPA